jgi:hypothetical protein
MNITRLGLTVNSMCDVNIFPYNYFYPINWMGAEELFKHENSIPIKVFKDTYSVHFYGKMSSTQTVNWQENSIYEYYSSFNCPFIYEKLVSKKIDSI